MAQESQDKTIIKGKRFIQTYRPEDPSQIICLSPLYLLDEKDYMILTKIKNSLSFWAYGIAMLGVGLLIPVISKYIHSLISDQASDIKSWEFIAVVIAFVSAIILKVVSCFYPDERKKLKKKIDKHFETSERKIGLLNSNEKR